MDEALAFLVFILSNYMKGKWLKLKLFPFLWLSERASQKELIVSATTPNCSLRTPVGLQVTCCSVGSWRWLHGSQLSAWWGGDSQTHKPPWLQRLWLRQSVVSLPVWCGTWKQAWEVLRGGIDQSEHDLIDRTLLLNVCDTHKCIQSHDGYSIKQWLAYVATRDAYLAFEPITGE